MNSKKTELLCVKYSYRCKITATLLAQPAISPATGWQCVYPSAMYRPSPDKKQQRVSRLDLSETKSSAEAEEHGRHCDGVHNRGMHDSSSSRIPHEVKLAVYVTDLVTRWPRWPEESDNIATRVFKQSVWTRAARSPSVDKAVRSIKHPGTWVACIRADKVRHWNRVFAYYCPSETAVIRPLEFCDAVLFVSAHRPPKGRHALAIGAYDSLEAIENSPGVEELAFTRILVGPRQNFVGHDTR